jgi:hypothetical protein
MVILLVDFVLWPDKNEFTLIFSFFLARHLFICIGDPFRYVCRFV